MVRAGMRARASVVEGGGGASPIFTDDFETVHTTGQTLSANAQNGVSWGSNFGSPTVETDQAKSGTRSLRFRMGPDADGSDSLVEQTLGLTDQAYLAVEYELWVPSNFVHRDQTGSTNNKFARWWMDGKTDNKYSVTTEFNRIDDTHSRHKMIAEQSGGATTENNPDMIGAGNPITLGAWHQIRFANQTASGLGNADGYYRMWIDGVGFSILDDFEFWNQSALGSTYISAMYFLGAQNSGYASQTDFFIDDVKIWNAKPSWDATFTP